MSAHDSRGEIYGMLPESFSRLRDLVRRDDLEEIRIRVGKNVQLVYSDGDELVRDMVAGKSDVARLVENICRHSIYAFEKELSQGYITVEGSRVGISGNMVYDAASRRWRFSDISGCNIRIVRECEGSSRWLVDAMIRGANIASTLIVSEPGVGKTTALRDIARIVSNGECVIAPKKVFIADERNEITASVRGVPRLNVGVRTDVIACCDKSYAMMAAIRALSPNVIITDEIGTDDDARAICEAVNCGVSVIASAHGDCAESVMRRPSLKRLVSDGAFESLIVIGRRNGMFYAKQSHRFDKENAIKAVGRLA